MSVSILSNNSIPQQHRIKPEDYAGKDQPHEKGLFDAQHGQESNSKELAQNAETGTQEHGSKELVEKALKQLGISPKVFGKDFRVLKKLFNQLYKGTNHQGVHMGCQMALIAAIKALLELNEALFKLVQNSKETELTWLMPKPKTAEDIDGAAGYAYIEMYTYNAAPREMELLRDINALRKARLETNITETNVEYYTLSEDFTYLMAKLNLKGSPPDVRKNTIWGLELLHQAAITEHIPEAMFSLGMLCYEGNKLNEDRAKAFKLFTQALKHFASSPDNRAKQEKTINYITQIVKLFTRQKLGDNLEVVNAFFRIKKAMQAELADYFQVKLEDDDLILSIDRNIICKEPVKANELVHINNLILANSE